MFGKQKKKFLNYVSLVTSDPSALIDRLKSYVPNLKCLLILRRLLFLAILTVPCDKLLVDRGYETTCISSSLVIPKCYTGTSVLLQSFQNSDKGS